MARVYTALATEEKMSGFLYDHKMNEVKANKFVYEAQFRDRLWSICESLTI